MSRMIQKHVPFTQETLSAQLRHMADLVDAGDSFEGSIEYLMLDVIGCSECDETEPPNPDCPKCKGSGMMMEEMPEGTYAMVKGAYRVGNTMGQGGMRMIGEWVEAPDEPSRS